MSSRRIALLVAIEKHGTQLTFSLSADNDGEEEKWNHKYFHFLLCSPDIHTTYDNGEEWGAEKEVIFIVSSIQLFEEVVVNVPSTLDLHSWVAVEKTDNNLISSQARLDRWNIL